MANKPTPQNSALRFAPPRPSAAALDTLMAQAQALHRAGRIAQAEAAYRDVLRHAPRHFDALHSLGLLALQAGHPQAAADLIAQALAVDPNDAEGHGNLGYALHTLRRHAEALASLDRALALKPDLVEALNNRGNTLSELGRHDDAVASFDRALALRPDFVEAVYNRGNALHAAGRLDAALASYDHVIAARADIPQAHNNRARVLQDLGRQEQALAGYELAIGLAPTYVAAIVGRGTALLALKQDARALADFDAALRIEPSHAAAHYDRGNALFALRRADDAVLAFTRCLDLDGRHLDARINRGNASYELRRYEDAIVDFDAVLRVTPDAVGVVCNRGNALLELKRYDEAAEAFRCVCALDAGYPYAIGKRLYAQTLACDWRDLPALIDDVERGLAEGRPVIEPFAYSAVATSTASLKRCAELFAADQFPAQAALVDRDRRYGHPKIRVGYVSGEFRNQATAILATELFELHDRSRFEIVAFDNGWNDGSTLRRRIDAAFDEVVDIAAMPDAVAARAIADREIDILVNLNGYFGLGRTGVFARHPAPVQVNYLGFPGTMGAPYLDVIVADADTIPPGDEGAYTERVVRLAGSYQPNDRQRAIADGVVTRARQGLPADAMVFACFNNTYKILPETFASWMRILQAVEGSVLWLLQDNSAATQNLRAAAMQAGIDANRLHFAPRIRLDEHLARHRAADLFLDTLPYNAHTTASDALWAGLPVLSCRGTTFPGRVGASLLHALGLGGELLVDDAPAYEARAIELATSPLALAAIRATLAERRAQAALFDTPRYCLELEAAFEQMLSSDPSTPASVPRKA
jgi:protein O-GlcNAc transferase